VSTRPDDEQYCKLAAGRRSAGGSVAPSGGNPRSERHASDVRCRILRLALARYLRRVLHAFSSALERSPFPLFSSLRCLQAAACQPYSRPRVFFDKCEDTSGEPFERFPRPRGLPLSPC